MGAVRFLAAGCITAAGRKAVDVLIRIALILFFSAIGWTLLASLIENRLASDIHGRPLPSARARTLLTLFRNALAVIISTITIMIVLVGSRREYRPTAGRCRARWAWLSRLVRKRW